MGVSLNAQRHSDSEYVKAIHRWEMGVCWCEHCVLLLAILIYWQGRQKPIADQAAGTLGYTLSYRCNKSYSDTSSPVPSSNQFTKHSWTALLHRPSTSSLEPATRNIPLVVPQIYRTYLYYLCFQKYGCILKCCTWPCARTVTVWVTAVSKCVAERGRMFWHIQDWELIVPQLTVVCYRNTRISLHFHNNNYN